ncbi:hypothetical protein [Micromonospora sp. NBC_00858]|uniref:hypothetical protein n=1 Tax=Micromonospora sp. NBC_00858 TaxID=2975979 RepID=UPI00386B179D|nr:hypothetical protein OG990_15290 [Micromonospora sp. NBC_00858]
MNGDMAVQCARPAAPAINRPAAAGLSAPRRQRWGTAAALKGAARIGIGCAWRGHHLTAIRDHHHITVYTADGHPIGHATTNDTRYVRLTPTP